MAIPTATVQQKARKPVTVAPQRHVHRDDDSHLETLDHLGLVRDEFDEKGPVEALFTHDNDSIHAHKRII